MEEVVVVDDTGTVSSDLASLQHCCDFKDPLGVNDQLYAAVDDESDEFDFDVSLSPNI